jgi:hypothetical protein
VTDLAPPPTTPAPVPSADPSRRPQRQRNRRRSGIALVMVVSLALSAVTRYWADERREAALPRRGEQAVSNTSLSSMNSFALGLLLGGLKGPLVMILWTDSENQKTEKNLEGVDTEIEWIRLLQPEFDTVHLFQIWNKAYNISVQMASLANKYDTILGALDYAHNVDLQKPDDINIIGTIGQLFFDKLGTSAEKVYYRRRVREESKPHVTDAAARRRDIGWRRITLDPVLDDHMDVLPSAARLELPYLVNSRYEPYLDGVSTFGFAYNYYKRAERLLNVDHQHHDQISDLVIDSRPALSLKNWADDEVLQGLAREAEAFGTAIPEDTTTGADAVLADLPPNRPVINPAALRLAIDAFDRTTRLAPDALVEYRRHIKNYPDREANYHLYMDEMGAEAPLAAGDRDYLLAMTATAPAERSARMVSAAQAYQASRVAYDRILLRYYTDPRVLQRALPPGYAILPTGGQKGLETMSDAQVLGAEAAADQMYAPGSPFTDPQGDRLEYEVHVYRAARRLELLGVGAVKPPTTKT